MFTADFEPDDSESMNDREDLEECVMEQILRDIESGLIAEVLGSLTKLSEDSLLEFLPIGHPEWQGHRQRMDTENALQMPPYLIQSVDPKVASQFLWSHN
jgi:hypothetical protein